MELIESNSLNMEHMKAFTFSHSAIKVTGTIFKFKFWYFLVTTAKGLFKYDVSVFWAVLDPHPPKISN